MSVFSARHDKYLPESSALGVKLSVDVVMLPSTENFSFTLFIDLDPFHQVIVAGGRLPAAVHVMSTTLSALSGLRSPSIRTTSGRTVEQSKRENGKNFGISLGTC